ncbi:type VII secretion-associated serine protease mycosin [Catellatospora paridis]|uniref:type VII secretion-associated serine protease mycosin n=1 Tax=Catellatospora paridis TaxID=1617086 RepID=UPI001E4A52A9|nr:type VII secretion-associated serine protease mycosin [Catellatospora paridis]
MSRLRTPRLVSAVPRKDATALLRVVGALILAALGSLAATTPQDAATPEVAELRAGAAEQRASRAGTADDQWQLATLHATRAWQLADGAGVTVAVVDSGVGDHADLNGQVLNGLDLVDNSGDGRDDPVGHGTTVAALIAGRADDGRGVVGLAPKAKILPVRVLDEGNKYDDARVVAEGVRWAVDHGAHVVNLSLGGGIASDALAEAIDYAFAKDVVVVACVGNVSTGGPTEIWYPAREPGVLAVTAIAPGTQHQLWQGSLTGEQAVLAAPGTDLVGARPGGYWKVQGTSFAAPLVSATAALVRSRWPDMPAAEVVQRLITTAQDLGPAGRDDEYGYGLVDPVAALTAEVTPVRTNTLDTAPPPGKAGFGTAPAQTRSPSPATSPSATAEATAEALPRRERGGLNLALVGVVALAGGAITALRRADLKSSRLPDGR